MFRRLIKLVIGILVLAVLAPIYGITAQDTTPTPTPTATPAPTATDIPDELANCAVSEEALRGQDTARIVGASSGGMLPLTAPPEGIVDPLILSSFTVGGDPVAILIIDDFSQDDSHGWLVLSVIESLLDVVDPSRTTITPIVVDIGPGYVSTDHITDVLSDVLYDPDKQPLLTRIVLNMSFVLLPCVTVRGQDGDDTLEEYARDHSIDLNTEAQKVDTGPIDPLHATIQSISVPNIPIASAGNFGGFDAFYPGAWTDIVSVSASSPSDPENLWINSITRVAFSNNGEIMVPGAWYAAFDNANRGYYVAGTSFAAPFMSVIAAMDLSYGITDLDVLRNCPFNNQYYLLPHTIWSIYGLNACP